MNVALIDGDIVAYKAACVNESVLDLGDDVISLTANTAEIEVAVDSGIEIIKQQLDAERVVVTLSDPKVNFRKALYEGYKRNRNPRAKPIGLGHAKKYMIERYGAKVKDALEADDVLGILATMKHDAAEKRIIVTIDKDLLQIPGRHFNPDTGLKRMVSVEQGDRMFFTQCLTGDSVDNYPGCKGVGPKGAEKILDADGEPWPKIIAAYEAKGFDEAFALTQARCARILRACDYNFQKKEPILWTP